MKARRAADTTRVHYAATIKAVCLGDVAASMLKSMIGPGLEGVEPILVDARHREREIGEALEGADMVVLVAGEGDDPAEAAPVIGAKAREIGALVAGVVVHPPGERSTEAEDRIRLLREAADMLIVVPDDILLPGLFEALRGA